MRKVAVSLAICAAICSATARAHDDEQLELARILVAEGGPAIAADHRAILHVLERRRRLPAHRKLSIVEVGRRYSTAFNGRARGPRAFEMRALEREQISTSILRLVERWLIGARVVDPCPGATHWAASWIYSPLRSVACREPTRNRFYF